MTFSYNDYRAKAVLAAALLSLLFGATGCGSSSTIATVNGQKISTADYDKKLEASPAGKGVLTQMIQSDLIDQYAKENNINPTDAEINAEIDKIKARYPNGQ
ncbi:MAG: SurA N-terminal domain-containing protein, partial [Candidatus Eremiobacteraeota bacterium]|nr:SurA N-terminal domain-containing protein [Candidatus Eremiobacteraeota bacterium]